MSKILKVLAQASLGLALLLAPSPAGAVDCGSAVSGPAVTCPPPPTPPTPPTPPPTTGPPNSLPQPAAPSPVIEAAFPGAPEVLGTVVEAPQPAPAAPAVSVAPAVTPTTVRPAVVPSTPASVSTLPFTGSDVLPLVSLSLALVAGGFALVRRGRKVAPARASTH